MSELKDWKEFVTKDFLRSEELPSSAQIERRSAAECIFDAGYTQDQRQNERIICRLYMITSNYQQLHYHTIVTFEKLRFSKSLMLEKSISII